MKGHISEDALEKYTRLVAEKQGLDFAEGETYDFARCMRADGTFYGTRGKCRKGKEAGEKEASGEGAGKRAVTAAQENKDARREARTRQVDRAALARQIAKETGKSVTDAAVQNEAVRRLDAKRGAPANEDKPKKLKTDFKKEVEAAATKRRAREAKMGELQTEIASRKKAWQETEAKVREAKKGWQEAKAMTPAQRKTPEGQKKLRQAGMALDRAERAAQKASDRMFASQRKLSRMTMTPEQRKEEREWNRTKRELG